MRDDVFQQGDRPGQRRRSSEFVVGTLQEGDEIRDQGKPLGGFQLALPRPTDRQQGIIQTIQVELIDCPVNIRRCQVGIQSDGLVGFGDRQLIFAGACQG
jgi:hypothetical protein